ncbi:uncharacterized protein [Ptychodera flava]|uniref:uncharacterized protein n=1 Tax=Ptychodera flava TaxID=63121 RepID=UPI00396A2EAF
MNLSVCHLVRRSTSHSSSVLHVLSMRIPLVILLAAVWVTLGKSPEEWKSRVIYQILTDRFAHADQSPDTECKELYEYCGGTFKGIQNNLDYISGLGVNAIWISPITENTKLGFHGYWPKNIYEVNPHFGTEQDLKDLIAACHERDIWVMADLVLNHMGYQEGCHWTGCPVEKTDNFTGFTPFDDAKYYHPYCDVDWQNEREENVQGCWLAYLPDLNQTNPEVRQTLLDWIQGLNTEYGFDGYRLDFVKGVSMDFWSDVDDACQSYTIGEAADARLDVVSPYQGPLDSALSFPMYYVLLDLFQVDPAGSDMSKIHDQLVLEADAYQDTTILGGFLDNHDQPRFLFRNSDVTALKNALVYLLMARWIPIIYYGTELGFNGGHDPNDRESMWPHVDTNHEIYKFIAKVNEFRSSLGQFFIDSEQTESLYDSDFYSFTRSETFIAITNRGSKFPDIERTISNGEFADGTVLANVLDPSDKVIVADGKFTVTLRKGEPKIYYAGDVSKSTRSSPFHLSMILMHIAAVFLFIL